MIANMEFDRKIAPLFLERGASDVAVAQGIICAIFPYLPKVSTACGNLSVYARGLDYHVWVRDGLKQACDSLKLIYPTNNFQSFCDISPYDEVMIGARLGLGVLGANRLLINKTYGSYIFIGLVKTDLQFETDFQEPLPCLQCGLCQKSCPSGAIKDGCVDSSKCLSHISQKRGTLEPWEGGLIGSSQSIWGCDICQRVCPMNNGALHSDNEAAAEIISSLSLCDLEGLSDKKFREKYKNFAFSFRGVQPLLRNLRLTALSDEYVEQNEESYL